VWRRVLHVSTALFFSQSLRVGVERGPVNRMLSLEDINEAYARSQRHEVQSTPILQTTATSTSTPTATQSPSSLEVLQAQVAGLQSSLKQLAEGQTASIADAIQAAIMAAVTAMLAAQAAPPAPVTSAPKIKKKGPAALRREAAAATAAADATAAAEASIAAAGWNEAALIGELAVQRALSSVGASTLSSVGASTLDPRQANMGASIAPRCLPTVAAEPPLARALHFARHSTESRRDRPLGLSQDGSRERHDENADEDSDDSSEASVDSAVSSGEERGYRKEADSGKNAESRDRRKDVYKDFEGLVRRVAREDRRAPSCRAGQNRGLIATRLKCPAGKEQTNVKDLARRPAPSLATRIDDMDNGWSGKAAGWWAKSKGDKASVRGGCMHCHIPSRVRRRRRRNWRKRKAVAHINQVVGEESPKYGTLVQLCPRRLDRFLETPKC
jgi:hypothetical protein